MSALKDTINADLKAAMIARDTLKVQTLQGLKAAILNEEVAKKSRDIGLDDDAILQIIGREAKKRDEAAELFDRGGNTDAAVKERSEKEILMVYLPAPLTETELSELIDTVIETMQPSGPGDMGKIIGAVKSQTGAAGDGAMIAKLVKEKLQ